MNGDTLLSDFLEPFYGNYKAGRTRYGKIINGKTYIIRAGDFIKIGWSADPVKRVNQIQTMCPFKCELIKTIDADIEVILHNRFSHLRADGGNEWYHLTDEIKEHLKILAESDLKETKK
jgi:hypothetical protein